MDKGRRKELVDTFSQLSDKIQNPTIQEVIKKWALSYTAGFISVQLPSSEEMAELSASQCFEKIIENGTAYDAAESTDDIVSDADRKELARRTTRSYYLTEEYKKTYGTDLTSKIMNAKHKLETGKDMPGYEPKPKPKVITTTRVLWFLNLTTWTFNVFTKAIKGSFIGELMGLNDRKGK